MSVSLIIPVHDGAPWLRETLDSVFAQTLVPDQIVVVDDGSTDASPDILRGFGDRLQVIRQANAGVAVARNVGLAAATGDLITFLDQDDLWPRDRMRLMVEALAAEPDADVAIGPVEIRYERTTPRNPLENLDTMIREYLLGSLCVRRRLFESLGPFSTEVGYGDDTDFWLRRRDAGARTIYLDAVTLIYRLHATNTSIDKAVSNFHFLAVLRESLKRRRAVP